MKKLTPRQISALRRIVQNNGREHLSPDLVKQLVGRGFVERTGNKYQRVEYNRKVKGTILWEVRLRVPREDLFQYIGRIKTMIKIVVVRVGQEPKIEEIEDTLEASQAIVDGYIECHDIGQDLTLVCNEDGIALGLPQNGWGMLGNYFFTKCNEEGDHVSLTSEECEMIMAHVAARRSILHRGTGDWTVKTFESMEELFAELSRLRDQGSNVN